MNCNDKIISILSLVSNLIEEDNNRNYGDRDITLHKLHTEWNEFIDNHPSELTPLEFIEKILP